MLEGYIHALEICSVEINIGQLVIEVSIQNTSPVIRFDDHLLEEYHESGYNVYVTARDKTYRRIWRSPIIDETGIIKCYKSMEEALTDVNGKLRDKKIPL